MLKILIIARYKEWDQIITTDRWNHDSQNDQYNRSNNSGYDHQTCQVQPGQQYDRFGWNKRGQYNQRNDQHRSSQYTQRDKGYNQREERKVILRRHSSFESITTTGIMMIKDVIFKVKSVDKILKNGW